MDNDDLEVLSQNPKGNNTFEEISKILNKFLKNNENAFSFSYLSEGNKREILWTSLFQLLQDKSADEILHSSCLAAIRVLSRDKTELESLICEKWISVLIDKAGLYNLVGLEEESMMSLEFPNKDIVVESMKCLCNIAFNSEVARAHCARTCIAQGLVARLRIYKDIPFKDEVMLYDMKLLFILTALRSDIKSKIKEELHGMDYLTSCLSDLVEEAYANSENCGAAANSREDNHCFISDNQLAIVCEILKTQFNLILRPGPEESVDDAEESIYLKLMPVLAALLCAHTSTQEKLMELRSNIANLLTSVPPQFYSGLTPLLKDGETAQHTYEGHNMDALQSLLLLLQHRLTITKSTVGQYESLSPILTCMVKATRGCRLHRKHLRAAVLPPLRHARLPPERGAHARNLLCALLTTPVTAVRDLAAEFLFLLCKENVGRMVKYTGFGNAAGHLAQKGLLSGGASGAYSSSSEDSDTEEYLAAQPYIDPVVGCTRPPRIDPFEGMTEEQKEYEAMKLVNLFDKMVSTGVVRPARAGPDGRPEPLHHVLELRDRPPPSS